VSSPALPRFLQLEPVGQCNLRCRMCSIQFRRDGAPGGPPAFLSFELFVRLVAELPELRELHLQGLGEPLMHPRFFDMVRFASERGVDVSTNTNGTLLGPRRAEACVTSGLAELHVSIDGASAETYETIRVRSRLTRVLRGLDRVVEARRRLGSPTPALRIVAVAMRRNLAELPALVELAHAHGVDRVFVQHLCHDYGEETLPAAYRPMREFVDAETLAGEAPERVERFFAAARATAERLGVDLRLPRTEPRPHPPGTPGPARCDWPWRGAYLSWQGEAMPCCMVSTPDRLSLGNAAPGGLAAVWGGEPYRAFRAALDSEEPPAICRSCSVYTGTF
jgi:MoaA/NifB/PqqE/SkfB family radical SAM enzyme